jgi:hypothetical protein
MYIHIIICKQMHLYVYIYIHAYVTTDKVTNVYIQFYIGGRLQALPQQQPKLYIYIYTYIYIYVYIYICIYIYISVYVYEGKRCVSITSYVNVYKHHIYICIIIYTCTGGRLQRPQQQQQQPKPHIYI